MSAVVMRLAVLRLSNLNFKAMSRCFFRFGAHEAMNGIQTGATDVNCPLALDDVFTLIRSRWVVFSAE